MSASWRNLNAALVSGTVEGHWDFDGDLTDSSGNGFDLVKDTTDHDIRYAILEGLQGACFQRKSGGTWRIKRSGDTSDAALRITGALTVHCLYLNLEHDTGSSGIIWNYGGSGETEATNWMYGLRHNTDREATYSQESGAGVDASHEFEVGHPLGIWNLLTVTRTAGGVVTLYIDGEQAGVASGALTAPTGGTTAFIRLGFELAGYMGGLMIISGEESAADIRVMYDHVSTAPIGLVDLTDTIYTMRAYHTVQNENVFWESRRAPDFTGDSGPYTPGDLTGIVLVWSSSA